MGLIGRLRLRNLAAMTVLMLVGAAAAQTVKKPSAPAVDRGAGPAPTIRIAVAPLGYVPPSAAYLSLKLSFNSLNFIDSDHLLFTFHRNMLLRRIPGDPVGDNDQMIRAVVLDTKSGEVLRQADWRMHDRGRYLWALRGGTFLVRVRNSLFLTDGTLQLRPYLTFDTALQGVEVSPERGLLMLEVKKVLASEKNEVEGDGASRLPPSLVAPGGVRQERTQMVLVRPGERDALAKAEFLTPAYVPLLENGVLDMDQGKKPNEWVIKKELLGKTEAEVGVVKSSCAPQLVTLSDDVVLSQNCPERGGSGTDVSALSLQGGVLWGELWDAKYIWGQFESSEDGSRFAYESLEMNRPIGSLDTFGEADVTAQPVGVFDTETGKLVMVTDASPILGAGQNFALSADGRRFAILRQGAIEVYDLPPVVLAAPEVGKKK
ncbi:MAG: hypothetical protein WAM66_09760 [Acidobacteriaceae bacterium]